MIELKDLTVALPGFSLQNVNLNVPDASFFALLGPTGAGKSLLLEAMAGLMPISSGKVILDGRDITGLPPEKRGFGMVYQDFGLFPHLSVKKNILYGLRYHNIAEREGVRRLEALAERLRISHLLKRGTGNLSGGEKQRVALARALIVKPKVLLLDEPMSALDPAFRQDVQRMLRDLHQELSVPFFMVTHAFDDVLFLADRAAVIRRGRIEQEGPTHEVFERPAGKFVAEFVGMKNVFAVRIEDGIGRAGGLKFRVNGQYGDAAYLAVRPEDILIGLPGENSNSNKGLAARVLDVHPCGFSLEAEVECAGLVFRAVVGRRRAAVIGLAQGQEVRLIVPEEAVHFFSADAEPLQVR